MSTGCHPSRRATLTTSVRHRKVVVQVAKCILTALRAEETHAEPSQGKQNKGSEREAAILAC